uniref:GH64 domain-containing protein n=1 Tax=Paenibacillus athensensis TaxID=1967502 RepID=A0A4Y8PT06_9BACL
MVNGDAGYYMRTPNNVEYSSTNPGPGTDKKFTLSLNGPQLGDTVKFYFVSKYANLEHSSKDMFGWFEYVVGSVSSPVFSPAGGVFKTTQNVTISNPDSGAQIYYTTDGSKPVVGAANTSLYTNGQIIPVATTTTLKAMAVQAGKPNSGVVTATLTIDPNMPDIHIGDRRMTIEIKNNSNGKYRDDQVYWMIVGKSYMTANRGKFVWVQADGSQKEMSFNDNNDPNLAVSKPLGGSGVPKTYVNYTHKLSDVNWVSIADIESSRLYVSYGQPILVSIEKVFEKDGVTQKFNADGTPEMGYGGPNIGNMDDPNRNTYFDFIEFNLGPYGYHGNTTRVDQFGFPVKLTLLGKGDGYYKTVGDVGTRDEIIKAFTNEVSDKFDHLATLNSKANSDLSNTDNIYRIVAPGKGYFGKETVNYLTTQNIPHEDYTSFFDDYINAIWNTYKTQELVFTVPDAYDPSAKRTYSGHVRGDGVFEFKADFNDGKGFGPYKYFVNKPTTEDALEGKGNFDKRTGGIDNDDTDVELAIEAQLCAAINRHLLLTENQANWSHPSSFFQTGPYNEYVEFWHNHSINNLAYGFCYDDVREQSTLLHTPVPQAMVVYVGW